MRILVGRMNVRKTYIVEWITLRRLLNHVEPLKLEYSTVMRRPEILKYLWQSAKETIRALCSSDPSASGRLKVVDVNSKHEEARSGFR